MKKEIVMDKQLITLKNPYKAKFGISLSRNEKRRAKVEMDEFVLKIEPIVEEFEKDLFNTPDKVDYNFLYGLYLEKITKACDWFNKHRCKVIQVDNYFFHETHKPLESLN